MEQINSGCVSDGKVRALTTEEETEYNNLEKEAETIRAAIKRAQAVSSDKSTVKELDSVSTKAPRIEVVREENHNEDGEYRGYAPVEKGGYGQFLSDVARAARTKEESKALRGLREYSTRAATGANEGVGADGGYLVQPDHGQNLQTVAKNAGVLSRECTSIPMSSNSTTIHMVDETSQAIGSQFGGVRAYWRAEAGSVTATRPKFREVNVKAEALEALFYATEEQLSDAPQLEAFADLAFREVMGFQLDDAIMNGNGAGKPLGILNAPCTISIAKESGQSADTLVYLNIDKMLDRLLVGYEEGAKFFVHPNVPQQLRNMVITQTNTDFMPFLPANGISGKPYDTINGRPIVRAQVCRALGDKGDIVLGNLKAYALFEKSGIQASQSMHVAFLTSERVFKWTMRANGMPLFNSAITDANGSTTRSPFVTLAERA